MRDDQPLLYSIDAAATQLGCVSARTVRRLIETGELPSVKVRGRVLIPAAALTEWVTNAMSATHNARRAGHRPQETTTCPTNAKRVLSACALHNGEVQPWLTTRKAS